MCYTQLPSKYSHSAALHWCQYEYDFWKQPWFFKTRWSSMMITRWSRWCRNLSFLNLRCTLEAESFENTSKDPLSFQHTPAATCSMVLLAISANSGRILNTYVVLQMPFLPSTNAKDYSLLTFIARENLRCGHICSLQPYNISCHI